MYGMNPVLVNNYLDDMEQFMIKHDFVSKPQALSGMFDEAGVQISPDADRVITECGSKQVLVRTVNTRDSFTMLVCISTNGRAMPPLFVIKGKTLRSRQSYATHDAPEGSVWTFQPKTWMDKAVSLEWLPERPQFLILGSHGSHEVVELLELVQQENIHIMALRPHTTHYLQPLDRVSLGHSKTVTKGSALNSCLPTQTMQLTKSPGPE